MPETKADLRPQIAHVLFMDIVGYSKLSINEQTELVDKLNEIVRRTEEFRTAEASGKLVRLPTGDGMALVFFNSPEAPVRSAVEISRALKTEAAISLRMGIHSGPVNEVLDVNERSNVAGAGIDVARRVMECGDAGHILVSKRAADDLLPYQQWRPHLQELGETSVKHGERISIFNFYTGEIGNPRMPLKLKGRTKPPARNRTFILRASAVILVVLIGVVAFLARQRSTISSSASVPEKSIAVLPFENLSNEEENAFFAGGVQDEILSDLAKIADLKVISRTSVMKYKSGPERNLREIAKVLGVAHIVEGSVQRAANRVRVSAQLIDARNDAHLWAEHYDRELADIFAIQTEIAQRIADQLRAKLSPQEKATLASRPTQDTEAYDLYLRAKELLHSPSILDQGPGEISNAVNLLEKAVARDPKFASAYCLLVEANLTLYWDQSVPGARERAEVALQAARRLAPEAAETHLAEGVFFYWGKRDYDHALESLEKAARVSPNNADVFRFSARVERRLGRWADAIRHQLRAIELDPRDWQPRNEAINSYAAIRDYAMAERMADRAIADFPEKADVFRATKAEAAFSAGDLKTARAALNTLSVPDSVWQLWVLAMLEHNYKEAERLLSVWTQHSPGDETLFPVSFLEGLTARATGQSEKARAAFGAARQHFSGLLRDPNEQPRVLSHLAIAEAALGQKEEALQEGRRAVELLPISRDPLFGADLVRNLALIYSWIAEHDQAIEQLSSVAKLPGGPSYGELKFDPSWDGLRGDPRFGKIVESLRPN
jgi:TolB-like protein/class 3 adenylate cyclase/Tfp pilus assembly protein PilF